MPVKKSAEQHSNRNVVDIYKDFKFRFFSTVGVVATKCVIKARDCFIVYHRKFKRGERFPENLVIPIGAKFEDVPIECVHVDFNPNFTNASCWDKDFTNEQEAEIYRRQIAVKAILESDISKIDNPFSEELNSIYRKCQNL